MQSAGGNDPGIGDCTGGYHGPAQYQKYTVVAPSAILRNGGKVIARSGSPVALEGPEERRRIVIIEFPPVERAQEWYDSPEYCHAPELRKDASVGELIAIEGFIPG